YASFNHSNELDDVGLRANLFAESFISINLEDNSIKSSSWEKKAIVPKVLVPSSDHQNDSQRSITKSCLAEHTKPRSSNLRWHNQIGHWFQLIAWKKRQWSN
ncbi:hypothetical protein Leryth_011610, partial [Lithospermum erythrorhizon]